MTDFSRYKNRAEAGKMLARLLSFHVVPADAIVLALPRGGVPVGYEVAAALGLEFDILLVRKLGFPGHEEYAMGAVGSGGVRVLNSDVVDWQGVPPATIDAVTVHEMQEIERREKLYRGERKPPELRGRVAILVDDGLATGSTMRAAVAVARKQSPARIVVAVPVGPPETCAALAAEVDELVCPERPMMFRAVGQWYKEFNQTSDEEVQDLLATAWREQAGRQRSGHEYK